MSDGNGALPDGWTDATLDDLGEWKGGGTPSKSNSAFWRDGNVPWVSPKDMKRFYLDDAEDRITHDAVKNSSAQLLPADSVLVVTRSGILQRILPVAINRVPVATNQDLKTLIPIDGIDSRYVAYLLKAKDQNLRDECSKDGTTVASIDLPKLKAYRFGLAPEAEQRRIVSKIESLQERSSRARRALSEVGPLLEQFRQSVLRAAFSGRLTADWRAAHRDVEPATELLSRIRTERRHRWEQSELAKYEAKGKKPPKNWQQRYKEPLPVSGSDLPQIPDAWAWATLDELTELITSGSRAWSKYYDKGDGTFIMAQNVRPGRLDFSEGRQLVGPPQDDSDRRRSQVRPGDLLVTIVGANTGDICPVEGELPEHWVCQSVALLRLVMPEMCGLVLRYFLRGGGGRIRFEKVIYGQGRPHLGFDDLREMPVPIPPLEEQSELLRVIADREESMDAIESGLAPLKSSFTQLAQSILAKAFRGELVPQDPRDEPASELLARIRTTREASAPAKPKRRKKKAFAPKQQPVENSLPPANLQRSLPLGLEESSSEQPQTLQEQPDLQDEPPVPIDDTDRDDVMAEVRALFSAHSDGLTREDAIRDLAHVLGYKRTGSRIHKVLGNDLIAAVKRRIIYRDHDRYYLDCRSIEDYDRDDLVTLLQRAMGDTWWNEKDAIREATRLVGFRRTGRKITDTWKKTVALAIRRDQLERDGNQIRRRRD